MIILLQTSPEQDILFGILSGDFLESQETNMKGLDIGCGNGKNILNFPYLNIDGVDKCQGFVDICNDKGLNVMCGDCLDLYDYKDESYDYAMSIAVYHHLSTNEHRFKAVMEMIRVLKPGGRGIFCLLSKIKKHLKSKKFQGGR